MANFTYQARDTSGKPKGGDIEAENEQAAASMLVDRGLMVISIRASVSRKTGRKRRQGKVKSQDLVVFTRQLATMMDAGLPLVQTLTALEEQTDNPIFKPVLRTVTTRVEQGQSFSEALNEHPKVFTKLYVSMVEAGETGGLLSEILDRLACYLESTARLKKKVKSAMSYPVIVCFIALSIALFLIVKVIPIFAGIYKDFGAKLPTPTQILIDISDIIRAYFVIAIIAAGGIAFGLMKFKRTKVGTALWDRIKLRLPVCGKLVHKIAISRFARTFAALLRSGVPILETLRIVGQSAGNTVVEESGGKDRHQHRARRQPCRGAGTASIFPLMLVRMVLGR